MNEAPLRTRVLSLARGVAGGYAVRLLADLGAECSQWRWSGPRPGDWPDDPLFRRYFEDGIEAVERPQPLAEVLQRCEALAASFDLVICDFSANEVGPGELVARLRTFNPAIVVANADHWGRTGPYARWAGDELTDYAMGGYWAIAGELDRAPLRVPGYQAQFHAGMQLAIAALAALRHARITGHGQEVESTGVEAMLGAHWSTTVAWTHEGRILKRAGCDLFRARDGWVMFFRLGVYANIFLLIERPDLLDAERFSTILGWVENGPELWGMVEEWCRDQTVDDIVNTAQELRIPVTPLFAADVLLADPVLAERGAYQEIDGAKLPGLPYRWRNPWAAAAAPSRLATLLASPPAGHVAAPFAPLTRNGHGGGSALAGIRIVEITNNWAGPICGRHLADLGAEVIKVELSSKPATRGSHYPGLEPGKYLWNRSGYFNEMNRNKRDISLNLATARGRAILLDLVAKADALVENNSARVLPNLGLGYEALSAVNPRLVMTSISGFGATGGRRDWVAFGSNIEATCGLAAMTGYPGGLPQRTGSFIADPIAGGHAAIAIIAGLERRDRTGEGAHIDISLTESALPFMLRSFTYLQTKGELIHPHGNIEFEDAPTGAYRCFGTDEWIAIAVRTDGQWAALAGVAGIDPGIGATTPARLARRAEIDAAVESWTVGMDQYEATRALQAAGVPAAPILHNYQMHSDPHLYARQAFIAIEHPDTGVMPYPGFPWQLGLTPGMVRSPAPQFAEGNDYVFRTLLGMGDSEIESLYADGVTTHVPDGMLALPVMR